jgi:hypothetical protein
MLSLAMVILTFQRVRSLASTPPSTPFLRLSLILSFNTPMGVVKGAVTGKGVPSPSIKHQKVGSDIILFVGVSREGESKGYNIVWSPLWQLVPDQQISTDINWLLHKKM